MTSIVGVRYLTDNEVGYEERDALVEVEVDGDSTIIDLHISPRTADVATVGLTSEEALRLACELVHVAAQAKANALGRGDST